MMEKNGEVRLKEVWPIIEEKLKMGGEVTINPGGISMKPLIFPKRDSVVLAPPPEVLKKYDVILYRRASGQFVLHRIVGMKDGKYVLCGDNQYAREYGIEKDAVIAIAKEIIRNKKKISLDSFLYKLYSVLWVFLQQINAFAHKIRRFLGKVKRKILG